MSVAAPPTTSRRATLTPERVGGVVLLLGTALVVSALSLTCWPVLLLDGFYPALVLIAAAGYGAWPVRWLLGVDAPRGQQVVVAIALGLGVTATATLVLGLAGWLGNATAVALVVAGMTLGFARVRHEWGSGAGSNDEANVPVTGRRAWIAGLVLLPLAYPTGVLLFGATLAPGTVWAGEGYGYDALSYHLQAQREYYAAGRVHFLPHNVYAQFPQHVEIHFLLLMHLMGGPYAAAIAAQVFHALVTIVAVVAIGQFVPAGWARLTAWLVAGSVPALVYTGVLAYVEGGLLLYAAVGGGLVMRSVRPGDTSPGVVIAAGLCAGLAGACKYTGLALVAVPLGLGMLLLTAVSVRTRLVHAAVFAVCATVAVSPWLLRNVAQTGNPVYPFAYSVFGGAAWSDEQNEQWRVGHRVKPEHDSVSGRFTLAWHELTTPRMFGFALFVLAAAGALLQRDRGAMLLVVWTLGMVAVWMLLTHMPWRFLMPIIAPLALLSGRALEWGGRGQSLYDTHARTEPPLWLRTPVVLVAIVGALLNAGAVRDLIAREERLVPQRFQTTTVTLASFVGATATFSETLDPLSTLTPADAHIWQVGNAAVFYTDREQHYTVAFSRDPWLAYAAEHGPAETIAWLSSRGVTHVVFSWPEIERLRATYGFNRLVTRAWVDTLSTRGLTRTYPPAGAPAALEIFTVAPDPPPVGAE